MIVRTTHYSVTGNPRKLILAIKTLIIFIYITHDFFLECVRLFFVFFTFFYMYTNAVIVSSVNKNKIVQVKLVHSTHVIYINYTYR